MLRSISYDRVMQREESEDRAFLTWFLKWFVLNSYILVYYLCPPSPLQIMFQNTAVHLC